MLYSGRMLRERKKKLVEREKASMSAWALTAASYFICQIHVAKVTFAFVVVLFTKPLMTSIVDDKVPNWRDDVDDDDGACPALNHYTIDQLGQPCCIWSLCSRQWTVNCGCECGSWLQLRSPIDCYRVSLLSVVVCLSNSCWGASLGLFCYPFFSLQALLYQRRVANLLTGTQNVIKCFADCALLSHNNNNNKCV